MNEYSRAWAIRTVRAATCGAIVLVLIGHDRVLAESLAAVKLQVKHVNEFAAGYDKQAHTYKASYIRDFITDPKTRPVSASVCTSLPPLKIKVRVDEGGHPCVEQTVRVAPGAVAFVWTLRGRHPISKQTSDLKQIRRDLNSLPHGNMCPPLSPAPVRIVPTSACEVRFDVPFGAGPAGPVAGEAASTNSIRFDAVNAQGHVIHTQTRDFEVPRKVPLIVSVGESLAAGQGNPDAPGKSKDDNWDPSDNLLPGQRDCKDDTTVMIKLEKKPRMLKQPFWFEPRDYRSLLSGPALAATELLDQWPYVAFLTFAKSGSKINSGPQDIDIHNQLEHVKRVIGTHRIDALLISAGANDVGFSDVLRTMAADFRNSDADKVLSKFIDRIPKLRNEGYPSIAHKIKSLGLNAGTVLINEYPGALFHDRTGKPAEGCGVFDSLKFWKVSKGDAVAISRMGVMLNEEVKLAADRQGWRFVTGIADKFQQHGYCASGQSFYRSAQDSCDMQGDFEGMMHPNEKGTAVYAEALARELRKALPHPGTPAMHK
jgi:lysophospholipase L1-like esterase